MPKTDRVTPPPPPAADQPVDERARLATLRATGLLDHRADPAFDRLTRLAASLLRVPVALVSLVDADRQLFTGCVGLPEPWSSERETPLSHSFCKHVVSVGEPLIVRDAREHAMVWDNPAIADLNVIAYAGIPLVSSDGMVLGSFCVIDHEPRDWTAVELNDLVDLAAAASTEIDLRVAERDAVDAAARLEVALSASAQGAWSYDIADQVRWNSARASEIFGLPPAESMMTAQEWVALVHDDDRDRVIAAFQAATEGGPQYVVEYRVRVPDGTVRWVSAAARVLRSDTGVPLRMVGTVRDDTERRRVAAAAEAGQQRLRAFVEAVPLVAWMNDADGATTFFNRRWHEYTGRPEGDEAPAAWLEQIHPDDLPRLTRERDAAIAAGASYELEVRIRRHDGVYRWHAARVEPVRGADGTVTAWSGAALDVDDRRRLEADLRESEARFRSVQDASPDGSLLMRAVRDERAAIVDFEITYANAAAAPLLLGTRESLVGVTIRDTFPDAVSEGRLPAYARVVDTGEPWQGDIFYARKGIDRGLRVTVVKVDDGVHVGLVDLSGRLAAAAERERLLAVAERARRSAEEANAVKAQFLATMSHELRTPLNAIGGYSQLIELGVHGPVTPQQLEAIGRIQRSQKHLLGLINEVLNYAKLEAGTVTYEIETMPVSEIVRAVEPLVAPQARAKQIALTIDACPADLLVHADAEKARQVVLNLLSNAVKFTSPGGRVSIACERTPAVPGIAPTVAIRVFDTGRGISAGELTRVFDPFVQVGRQLTSAEEGTGLGLAISRDLARGMGGDLSAESTLGVGSMFTLTLPSA